MVNGIPGNAGNIRDIGQAQPQNRSSSDTQSVGGSSGVNWDQVVIEDRTNPPKISFNSAIQSLKNLGASVSNFCLALAR